MNGLSRVAFAGACAGWLGVTGLTIAGIKAQEPAATQAPATVTYFCPMHPDVTSPDPGRCRKCDMVLLPGDPFDTRDYHLDVETSPAAVKAGTPFTIRLSVSHPGTGAPIRDFQVVHDKQYHLFLISQDMTSFQHLHPTQQQDGSWTLTATVPRPGYYRVLSDFVPTGGAPQFLGQTFVTAGFVGDMESQRPQLEEDWATTKTVDGMTATLALDPQPLVEGR